MEKSTVDPTDLDMSVRLTGASVKKSMAGSNISYVKFVEYVNTLQPATMNDAPEALNAFKMT